jgi:hypothetical protein
MSAQMDSIAMTRIVHPVAGAVALVTIAVFWVSTALSGLFASDTTVAAVKMAIPWGFLLLVPALVAVGGSGFALAKGRRGGLIGAKAKRMPLIAANGLLVLIPSALFLASKAGAAEFDAGYYTVQAVELAAGVVNITLLGLNMRDGLTMRGWSRRQSRSRVTVSTGSSTSGRGGPGGRSRRGSVAPDDSNSPTDGRPRGSRRRVPHARTGLSTRRACTRTEAPTVPSRPVG